MADRDRLGDRDVAPGDRRPVPDARTDGRPPRPRQPACRPAQLLALQRSIGNRRLGTWLSAGRQTVPAVQRQGAPPALDPAGLISKHTTLNFLDEEELAKELARGLPDHPETVHGVLNQLGGTDQDDVAYELAVAMANRLGDIPEGLRLRMIGVMSSGAVTDDEEKQIAQLWQSFGWTRLGELASQPGNLDLWRRSLDESDELVDFVRPLIDQFRYDVVSIGRSYLEQNRNEVRAEGQRMGIDVTGAGDVPEGLQQEGYLEGILKLIPTVQKLQHDRDELLNIQVGYNSLAQGRGGASRVPAVFRPGAEPTFEPTGQEDPPIPTYRQINARYEEATSVIAGFANLYPSIYTLLQQGKIDELASIKDVGQAQKAIGEVLRKTHTAAVDADRKLQEGDGKEGSDIEYYDLKPIHGKLFDGSEEGRQPWNTPFYTAIANYDLKDHAAREYWTSLGLSAAAAAALIAAPLTGGATAAILVGGALAVGAAQAGVSWEKYANLSTAKNATVRDELGLVSQGQVDEAFVEAVVNTLAVVLDAYGARGATTAARGARATPAAVKTTEAALEQAAAQQARKRAVREAIKDAAVTGVTTGADIALHELDEDEPPVITDARAHYTDEVSFASLATPAVQPLAVQPLTVQPLTVQPLTVQRGKGKAPAPVPTGPPAPPNWGDAFEQHIIGALRRGEIEGIPTLDFVIPGQYTDRRWGIDIIGVRIDKRTGKFTLFHFECKWVEKGNVPELKTSTAGVRGGPQVMQTSEPWTRNAAEHLMIKSNEPVALEARKQLIAACSSHRKGGGLVSAEEIVKKLIDARVHVFTPAHGVVVRIFNQIAAMRRWGRLIKGHRIPIP